MWASCIGTIHGSGEKTVHCGHLFGRTISAGSVRPDDAYHVRVPTMHVSGPSRACSRRETLRIAADVLYLYYKVFFHIFLTSDGKMSTIT